MTGLDHSLREKRKLDQGATMTPGKQEPTTSIIVKGW